MFVEVDFDGLQHAAKAALGRGEDPAIQSIDRLRDEAMKRKILQADLVKHLQVHAISQKDVFHLALGDGLMEGFYVVAFGRQQAWRWENDDEGEEPCLMSVPRTTTSGLPKICGTCRHSLGPRFNAIQCTIHPNDNDLTIYFTCSAWSLREDM